MREIRGYVRVQADGDLTNLYGPDGLILYNDLKMFGCEVFLENSPVAMLELRIAECERDLELLRGEEEFVVAVNVGECWDLYGARYGAVRHDGWSPLSRNGMTAFEDFEVARYVARELARQTWCKAFVCAWYFEMLR